MVSLSICGNPDDPWLFSFGSASGPLIVPVFKALYSVRGHVESTGCKPFKGRAWMGGRVQYYATRNLSGGFACASMEHS
jgi:hypothetical protein